MSLGVACLSTISSWQSCNFQFEASFCDCTRCTGVCGACEKHKVRALQLSQCGSPFLPSMPGAGHDTSDKIDKASHGRMPLGQAWQNTCQDWQSSKRFEAPNCCNSHDRTWEACAAEYPVQQFLYLEEFLSILTHDRHCAYLCMSMCQPVINSIFLNGCIACLSVLSTGVHNVIK